MFIFEFARAAVWATYGVAYEAACTVLGYQKISTLKERATMALLRGAFTMQFQSMRPTSKAQAFANCKQLAALKDVILKQVSVPTASGPMKAWSFELQGATDAASPTTEPTLTVVYVHGALCMDVPEANMAAA